MDKHMQALIDAPLANALSVNLPLGRRPAKRATPPVWEDNFAPEKLTGKQIRERREDAFSAKLRAVLDYYAGTNVPFDRIATHTKMTVEQITESMARRGRSS